MSLDRKQLQDLCEQTLAETNFEGLGTRMTGKVRDSYVGTKHRTLIVTDRVSCFDVVVGTIPLKGQVLVDTKHEMGLDDDGNIIVIDEIHTPDSSRYWRAQDYESALAKGRSPTAIDKEYVRLWLGEQGYKGEGTPPELPVEIRVEAATRYIAAFEQISGMAFEPNLEEPAARIRRNLGLA